MVCPFPETNFSQRRLRLNDGTCCVSALTCQESELKISGATCLFNFFSLVCHQCRLFFFPTSLGHVVFLFSNIFWMFPVLFWQIYISSCFRSPSCPEAHLCDRPALTCCTCVFFPPRVYLGLCCLLPSAPQLARACESFSFSVLSFALFIYPPLAR